MAARVKSYYNTSAENSFSGMTPYLPVKITKPLLRAVNTFQYSGLCNSAATDSLVAEFEEFDKRFRKHKRHLDDKDAAEHNKGGGSYPTKMLLLIVVLMEKLGISSKETAERALYDLRFRFALGIEDIYCRSEKKRQVSISVKWCWNLRSIKQKNSKGNTPFFVRCSQTLPHQLLNTLTSKNTPPLPNLILH